MQVSNSSSVFDLSSIRSNYTSTASSDSSTSVSSASSDEASVSNLGQLMSAFSSMSEEEKAEADSFRDSILSAVESGEYDAESLASNAPDSLVALAEENGIDLEELVDEIANMSEQAPPPPPSGGMGGMDMSQSSLSFSDEEMQEAEDYRTSLIEAMDSGEFDAATLAESAPDAVVAMAEEAGMSVEDFITQVAEDDQEGNEDGNMPPPPPSNNSSALAGLSVYNEIQSSSTQTSMASALSQLFAR